MPKRNRAYKKGEPHRDARLFVIVAEGEREDGYFSWYHQKNQRIQIKMVPREENRSAPNHFLDRVDLLIREKDWSPEEDDRLWFVLDVDRWQREELENLRLACERQTNWHIGISNPCFEVWLIFHRTADFPDNGESCAVLKTRLNDLIPGGYAAARVCPLLRAGVDNARNADTASNSYFPDRMQTKLYALGEQILELLGPAWNRS